MRKATIVRKPRGRGRRTSGPSCSGTTDTDASVRRMSVPAVVESLKNSILPSTTSTSTTLTLEDNRSLYKSSTHLTGSQQCDKQSYGSVLSQIKENSTESEGIYDFLSRTFQVLWRTILTTVFLLMLLALPVSMIAVGSTYQHECPKEPRIPIYLLVGGCFGSVKVILMLWNQKKKRDNDGFNDEYDSDSEDALVLRSAKFTGFILNIFLTIWFVIGNIWYFQIWKPNFKQPLHEPRNWCNEIVFWYTLYNFIICYSLIGLSFIIVFGFICYYCCKSFNK